MILDTASGRVAKLLRTVGPDKMDTHSLNIARSCSLDKRVVWDIDRGKVDRML